VYLDFIIIFLFSYILGSIPFGLILTKIFLNEDIRKVGSGNIGATNVFRTGKKSLAGLTLLLDILKGYLTVIICLKFNNELIFFSGLICFVGHVFPVWLKFKGGKGVATYLGVILALSFKFALIFGFTWFVILFLFKYSSVSSIFSSLIVFLFSLIYQNNSLSIFLFILFVMILYTHKDNIVRLKTNRENKINF
jgi:glycerol-3-phosphate acyltransferase PlsY|tara:strand:+ start:126 stop:707 length:582 start_codon:yes stop_codon:yes gene_type:complete